MTFCGPKMCYKFAEAIEISVIIMPAEGLAPLSARPSSGPVKTKCITGILGPKLKG